jgi:hypothetical protein
MSELLSVSASSASSAWAVGEHCTSACGTTYPGFNALILHWNGTAWSRVPSPSPASTLGPLFGVSAISPANAWAVGPNNPSTGHALILHWNGTAWSRVPSPAGGPGLLAVTATSATSAWAVGDYSTASGQPRTLIVHWNGTSWSLS